MPDYTLNISKKGENDTGQLLVRVGKQNVWFALKSSNWFTAKAGNWHPGRDATKFRQFSFIALTDSSGYDVARLAEFPYSSGQKFIGSLMTRLGPLQFLGESFEVEVQAGPPPYKTFRLREIWGAALSVGLLQGETVTFEINDPQRQETTVYSYTGSGLAFSPPKLPNVLAGVSGAGPWNEFKAPSWWTVKDFGGDACLQAPYNLGVGTAQSYNIFQFRGNVDNYPGFEVEIQLQTGRTYALPSAGFTTGSMELVTPTTPVNPRKIF